MLKHWSIRVGKKEIQYILCSNPFFPSIKSVYDTLSYYGLESNVYKTDFNHIKDKSYSIIHTTLNDGRFYCTNKINDKEVHLYDGTHQIMTTEDFLKIWDGYVLLVESARKIKHSRKHEFMSSAFKLFLTTLLILSVYLLRNTPNAVIQTSFDCIGFILSFLLLYQSMFEYQKMPFCYWGRHFDCSIVSKTNPLRLFFPIGLPFIGISFFIFDWMLNLLGGTQNMIIQFIYWFAMGCMLFLVVYQWIIIKKYCLYCLCISAIVCSKPLFITVRYEVNAKTIIQIAIATTVSLLLTMIIDDWVRKNKDKSKIYLNLLTIKRIPHLFDKLLALNPILDISAENALVFGNENAKITLSTIINIDCLHCRKIVSEVCTLIERHPTSLCWRIFLDGFPDIKDKTNYKKVNCKQIFLINEYLKNRPKAFQILKKWNFNNRINTISPEAHNLFSNLVADIRKARIDHYPITALNNHIFPREYEISDIDILMGDWGINNELSSNFSAE